MKALLGLGLAAAAAIIWWWPKGQPGRIRIGNTHIQAEKAVSSWEKARGLSGRQKLAADAGMLFIYSQPGHYPFWMQGMNFNLDFVFIKDKAVVDIRENIPSPQAGEQPVTITPNQPVDSVLEVNSGFVAKHKIKIGDKAEY